MALQRPRPYRGQPRDSRGDAAWDTRAELEDAVVNAAHLHQEDIDEVVLRDVPRLGAGLLGLVLGCGGPDFFARGLAI